MMIAPSLLRNSLTFVALVATLAVMPGCDKKEEAKGVHPIEYSKEHEGGASPEFAEQRVDAIRYQPATPEPAPEVEPDADAIRHLHEIEPVPGFDDDPQPQTFSNNDALSPNVITITNNEADPLLVGTFNPRRSGVIPGHRTVRLSRAAIIWVGVESNRWSVEGGTRYIAYDRQGSISLAVFRRD